MSEYLEVAKALSRMLDEDRHLGDCLESTSPIAQQICYGVTRNWFYYDRVTEALLDKPLPEKHLDLWLILLAGLYSIDHLRRPQHASVNHAVESVVKLDKPWAKGLVNAVLRRYGREADNLKRQMMESDEARLNHPQWLIELIRADWPDHPEIFEHNNNQPPMTLRVNTSRITREQYLAKLSNHHIEARAGVFAQSAVILDKAMPVEALPGFRDGDVSVQDEAPQLVPGLMNLEPGLSVIDACAAPGGKTCHLLENQPGIKLTSIDRDIKRIHLINENLERLSLQAEVVTQSFEEYITETKFDRILVDAPCSATGIIRRHPDIKLLRTKSDVDKLSSIQRGLLEKAFDLLTIGGEMLYSTCSILRQENDSVISDFIAADVSKQLIPLSHPECGENSTLIATEYGMQFLPTADEHDGFYYAGIRKVAI